MAFGRSRRSQDDKRASTEKSVTAHKTPIVGLDGTARPYSKGSLDKGDGQQVREKAEQQAREKAEQRMREKAAEKVAAEKTAAEKAAVEKAASERAAAEKAAADKAKAEAEAALANVALSEERAKQAAEEAAWRSELVKMTSTEAFGAQLTSKLAVDLTGLRRQITKGERTLEATAAELQALTAKSATAEATSGESVARLEEERASVLAVQQLLAPFETDAATFARQVESEGEISSQQQASLTSVRARMQTELDEASARRCAAEDRSRGLQAEIDAMLKSGQAAEKTAEAELAYLEDEATSARLKVELAQRMAKLYQDEADQLAAQGPAARLLGAKKAQVEQTAAQVAALHAQLRADEDALQALAHKERDVTQRQGAAEVAAAQRQQMYSAQLASLERLQARQAAFVDDELSSASRREGVGAAEAQLLAVAVEFGNGERRTAAAAVAELQARMASLAEEAAAEAEGCRVDLRQIRAEAKALTVAVEHRRAFVATEEQRLSAEQAEAAAAAVGLDGRDTCVAMVSVELDASRQICETLEVQAAAAERAASEHRSKVDGLKAAHRSSLAALRGRLASEDHVLAEQRRYALALHERLLSDASLVVVGESAGESAVQRVSAANASAAAAFAAELRNRLEGSSAALAEARRSAESAKREVASEAKRLEEQSRAMGEALHKLREYEASLAANLAAAGAAPSDAAAVPPAVPAPAASLRASDRVEAPATPRSAAVATAPGAPSPLPEDLGMTLATLRSLRSSAAEAIEAARTIDRVSADARPPSPVSTVEAKLELAL